MDEDYDSFDLGETSTVPTAIHDDYDDVENHDIVRRDLSMAMTQKLYGNLGAFGAATNSDFERNNYIEPRNKFEELLYSKNVKIAVDEENYEKFVVFCEDLNHEQFTRNMETQVLKNRGLFEQFTLACNNDPHAFSLYLTPTKSKFGLQGTIFRAFLEIKPTQTKAFDLLLQKLNVLAKKSDSENLQQAQVCVAHMRHLNRLFEPLAVFNIIFEFEFRYWDANVRNDLIVSLPEIFTDISLQQATAIRLNQEILETQNIANLPSFHLSIVETLRLLRMDSQTGRQIRMNLIGVSMQLDAFCLPSLIAFSLATLLTKEKNEKEEEELMFHEVLLELAKTLKIEQIKKKTTKADVIASDIFAHFFRFLQLEKKSWKYITSWVNRTKKKAKTVKEESENGENSMEERENSADKEEPEETTWMSTFEALLIVSLLSNSESCPPTFIAAVNARILNMPTSASTVFLKLIELVISLKKFASTHLSALIHVAKHCLWSPDANTRTMGVNIWKQLFVGMEKKDRIKVFNELMKHFSQSELECEAVLDVFSKVIKSNANVILEFSTEVQKCVTLIPNLSISNIKRLFQVMLMLSVSSKDKKFEIDEIINRFLTSVCKREKFLGVLALLMKIQVEMNKKHTENQEVRVREGVERIEEAVKSSPILRGAFYEHMRLVIESHRRTEEIRYILEWSDDLLRRFKEDFFVENEDESMEGASSLVLKPHPERQIEVAPMFNLIKELQVLRMRWQEEDNDSISSSYDVSVIKSLNFAFESMVSLDCEDSRSAKLEHYYFLTQWSRTVLNGFLAQSSVDFLTSEEVSKIATKLFYLMMDSQSKLASTLTGASQWTVPNLKFERKEDVIVMAAEKKAGKGRPKKRKSDDTLVETMAEETVHGEEEELEFPEKKTNLNVENQLKSHFVQLKLRPIVHLMKLAKKKRSCLIYLCDELQNVLAAIANMKKKSSPMTAARMASTPTVSVDKLYHGDAVTIWFCVKKAVEQVWNIVESVFDYFSALPEASQETNPKCQKDMEELGEKSLHLLHTILSGELYGSEEKLSAAEKVEKISVLLRIVEKTLLDKENLSNDVDQAKFEIAKYLEKIAEFAPTPAVAVFILDVFEDLKLDEDDHSEDRKTMAKFALAFLKKDWSKVDEVWNKGPKLNNAVRDILSHYIRLRKAKDQLLAIQWILTNKVVQLVPDDDKRRSCVFSQHSDDDFLEKEDRKALFYCINKSTFGTVFKTLFSALNTRIGKHDMSSTAAKNLGVDEEETLASWEVASSSFLVLCLLLRVNKIRTVAVLTTAIREGKQFLITVSKKSSFIHLMDNITNGSNFDAIYQKVERILSAVQQGNRVLQSIGIYAKTNKCVHLLKKFPELRAESENCLRVIHSAMVKNECLNAFTVGLVKSRSIDGEIITEQRSSSDETEDEE